MADLRVTAHYNHLPAKTALFVIVLLLPIWGILVPVFLGFGIWHFATNPGEWSSLLSHLVEAIGLFLGLCLIPIVGTFSVLACADNRIIATRAGLQLPVFIIPFLTRRRELPWSSIKRIEIKEVEENSGKSRLILFLEKRKVALKTEAMPRAELEQLLIATELWGAECERDQSLIEFREKMQETSDDPSKLSYTTMWEQELERRFSSTSFVPLEPGACLQSGKLRVVRQLSFGGLSAIYLCQENEKKLVVLKEMVVPQGANAETKEKASELFAREAMLLMKLDHPSIVKVMDYFVENGRSYLLIEYLNGQDLRQFVKQNGAQSEAKALRWGAQICGILHHLHNQSPPIVHRDLTPDNLVLKDDDSIVLIDFGAANEFIGTATGTLVGKQCFIAPEQFRGKAVTQTDLYALGCTLYFLVTGSDPEALSTSRPADQRSDLSPEFDKLTADLTAMNVSDRIATAQEAKLRMDEILASKAGRAA